MLITHKVIIIASFLAIVNILLGFKYRILQYVAVIILLFISFCVFKSKAQATTFIYDVSIEIETERHFFDLNAKLTAKETEYYAKKLNMHKENALRTFNNIKETCWWLPNLNDREKARYCFTTLVASLPAGTPQSKIIASLASFLAQYGLDCLEQWNYLSEQLYWCQYHNEMIEFYSNVLVKA